ncbi:MAG: formylglycine-generating enzyme family protein [Terriglobales bacterium]
MPDWATAGCLGAVAIAAGAVLFVSAASAADCRDPTRHVPVPAGEFWMGSDAAERQFAESLSSRATIAAGWIRAELPRRLETTLASCIDRTPVTQASYADFVGRRPGRPPGITRAEYLRQGFLVHDYETILPYRWRGRRPPPGKEDHPVVLVSAPEAEAYCRWRLPAGRLPTEVEWEKTMRGTDGPALPWGGSWDPFRLNSAAAGPGGTTPVGRYPAGASPYGALDAVGSVFQWTSTTLSDGRRVLKGCAWDDEAGLCRPAFRHGRPPTSRHVLTGFRCLEGRR